jgi:hypothetical protein
MCINERTDSVADEYDHCGVDGKYFEKKSTGINATII